MIAPLCAFLPPPHTVLSGCLCLYASSTPPPPSSICAQRHFSLVTSVEEPPAPDPEHLPSPAPSLIATSTLSPLVAFGPCIGCFLLPRRCRTSPIRLGAAPGANPKGSRNEHGRRVLGCHGGRALGSRALRGVEWGLVNHPGATAASVARASGGYSGG